MKNALHTSRAQNFDEQSMHFMYVFLDFIFNMLGILFYGFSRQMVMLLDSDHKH